MNKIISGVLFLSFMNVLLLQFINHAKQLFINNLNKQYNE